MDASNVPDSVLGLEQFCDTRLAEAKFCVDRRAEGGITQAIRIDGPPNGAPPRRSSPGGKKEIVSWPISSWRELLNPRMFVGACLLGAGGAETQTGVPSARRLAPSVVEMKLASVGPARVGG